MNRHHFRDVGGSTFFDLRQIGRGGVVGIAQVRLRVQDFMGLQPEYHTSDVVFCSAKYQSSCSKTTFVAFCSSLPAKYQECQVAPTQAGATHGSTQPYFIV
jgi:hypothetical protein